MSLWLSLAILLPAVGALLSALTQGRQRAAGGLLIAVATTIATAGLVVGVWRSGAHGLHLHGPGGWEAVLVADGLAVVMLLMASGTALFVTGFAVAEDLRRPGERHPGHWPLWFALWASLQVLFLGADLLTVYLMFEVVGVVGAVLVLLGGDRPTTLAGTRYLFAELAATTTVLLGIAVLWRQTGSLVFAELGPALAATPDAWWGLGIVTSGLLLKVPLVPVHLWLPHAHTLAPSAVSPALSAVVVKSAFVVLVRMWFGIAPALVTPGAAQLLGILGVVAIVWGSVLALRVDEVKRLIAYSTLAQLGFMFLLPPLVEAGGRDAWNGGVFYAVAHAPAKAALLMAAAVLVDDAGRPQVSGLAGAATRRPMAVLAVGVGAVSLVGLPPTGGFVAKWYLLLASVETGQWWWIPPLALGSLLTAAYLMRLIKPAFAPSPAGWSASAARDWRDGVALALSLTTVVLGLRPQELLQLIEATLPAGWST